MFSGSGNASDTRGTAYVVFDDIYDAKNAVDHLNGYNVGGRYLVVLYHKPDMVHTQKSAEAKKKEVEQLRASVAAKEDAAAASEP